MIKPFFLALFVYLSVVNAYAQIAIDRMVIYAGLHIGGVAPASIPQEIRSIESYRPVTPISLGVEFPFYHINDKWSLSSGLNLVNKGMKSSAFAENFKAMIDLEDTPYRNMIGYFTGSVNSSFNNLYLELPVSAHFELNPHWSFQGGIMIDQALARSFEGGVSSAYIRIGEPTAPKIEISSASFNTSRVVRKADVGLHLGATYNLGQVWQIRGVLNYGLTNVIDAPSENIPIKLHNTFLTLSAGYILPFSR